jgi:hypothetical protein
MKDHPPGTVVLPISDQLRFPDFFIDYSALEVPEGTKTSINRSASIVGNLNNSLLDMPPEHEWAWFLADDHVFPSGLLMQLLDHEVDVIVPLCVKRTPPFQLVIMREETEIWNERMNRNYPGFIPYKPEEVPDEVFPVVAAGTAGMLVRRHVLDKIGFPHFESTDGVYLNEDLDFCQKIRRAGFEILCDPHAYLGHIGQMHIWPARHEGQLAVKIDCGGANEVFLGENLVTVAIG